MTIYFIYGIIFIVLDRKKFQRSELTDMNFFISFLGFAIGFFIVTEFRLIPVIDSELISITGANVIAITSNVTFMVVSIIAIGVCYCINVIGYSKISFLGIGIFASIIVLNLGMIASAASYHDTYFSIIVSGATFALTVIFSSILRQALQKHYLKLGEHDESIEYP